MKSGATTARPRVVSSDQEGMDSDLHSPSSGTESLPPSSPALSGKPFAKKCRRNKSGAVVTRPPRKRNRLVVNVQKNYKLFEYRNQVTFKTAEAQAKAKDVRTRLVSLPLSEFDPQCKDDVDAMFDALLRAEGLCPSTRLMRVAKLHTWRPAPATVVAEDELEEAGNALLFLRTAASALEPEALSLAA